MKETIEIPCATVHLGYHEIPVLIEVLENIHWLMSGDKISLSTREKDMMESLKNYLITLV